MPLSSIVTQEVNKVHITMNKPKNHHHKATLFYGFSVDAHSQSDHLLDPDHDEEAGLSYALDMHKEAKLIKLLWNVGMKVDDEGEHSPTTPIFKELWAPSKVHRFYTSKEEKNTQGLGYISRTNRFKNSIFTRLSKAPKYNYHAYTAMVIEDLSDSIPSSHRRQGYRS